MFDKIKEIMVDTLACDEEKITPEASITDDLGIDSLDSVEIVLELESAYDIKIEDEEIQNLKTVGDIMKLVESKLN